LITSSAYSDTVPEKIKHIAQWAKSNNLKLNQSKTREMIIHRKGVSKEDRMNLPDVIDGVERVTCMKILGVYFDNALSFKNQLERVLRGAASSMYAIKILRSKGLSGPPLWDVTTQTAVSKMLYASSAWWGYMDDTSRKRLNAIITRLVRLSCLSPKHKTFDSLCDTADQQLFDNI
jgi:hypothetical protein